MSIALAHEPISPDHKHASAFAVSDCGSQGIDGEGCAEITNLSQVVVGSDITIELEFTVGASGIPIGGGVSIGFHHGANWDLQVTDSAHRSGCSRIRSLVCLTILFFIILS